jgi:hypothetical protein
LGEVCEEIGLAGAREGVDSGLVGDSGEEKVVLELLDQEVNGLVGEHVLNFLVVQQIDPKELVTVEGVMGLGVVEPQETSVLQGIFPKFADFGLNFEPNFSQGGGIGINEYYSLSSDFERDL